MIALVLLAVGIDASAQEFTGSIYGRIVDPTNALHAWSLDHGGRRRRFRASERRQSEANGSYRFLNLPPGDSTGSRIRSRKFKKIVYEGAKVEVDKTSRR